jgi:photosystem II stability/assembly factor-like uncharacterized protein
MAKNFTICMGTLGTGLWRSTDGGERWQRARLGDGYQGEKSIYGLAVHPKDPATIYAAGADGVYISRDRGANFDHIDSPMNTMNVWRIVIDPIDPDTIFAGTRPAAVFRSKDGGQHWTKVCGDFAEECMNVGTPRITGLAVDPTDHRRVWAGAEVDGVRMSLDGGDTWTRVTGGLLDEPDIHDITVLASNPTRVMVATPQEICVSDDQGDSWQGVGARERFSMPYCRSVAVRSDDPSVVFVGTGNGALGDGGAIQRSTDGGKTWDCPRLPMTANSYIAAFATHAADPDLILAGSHNGQLFASPDGGDWWVKLPREGTEIRSALAWIPN